MSVPAAFVFLALASACVAVALTGERGAAALAYERTAVAAGAWWRLGTAHLVHLSRAHLLLNLAGLAVVLWLIGRAHGAVAWSLILAVAAGTISAALHIGHNEIVWYVGLSGVLHGVLAAGLVPGLASRQRESLLLALLLAAKLAWEAVFGPLPGSEESAGGPVLVEAHLYGALGGGAAGLGCHLWAAARRSV